MAVKKVLIFGSTGSVGKKALAVILHAGAKFNVYGLCAYRDSRVLLAQIKQFNPRYVCLVDDKSAARLRKLLPSGVKLFAGVKGLDEFSRLKSDISLMAISGIACLRPLMINLAFAKRIALANKESIVVAGDIVLSRARSFGCEVIPVDSEINSLFQLFAHGFKDVRKAYITASGGALVDYHRRDLKRVASSKVLTHPNWKMGRRITVDSATLVNKSFEVIETHHFFGFDYKNIGIVLHRQSMVHAMLEFCDGAIFACIYQPDMAVPIAAAFYHPRRNPYFAPYDFSKKISFSFEPLPRRRFPAVDIVLAAAKEGGNSLAVINACDEVAVDYFLKGAIKFDAIVKIIDCIFRHCPRHKIKTAEDVFFWDNWARNKTTECINSGRFNKFSTGRVRHA